MEHGTKAKLKRAETQNSIQKRSKQKTDEQKKMRK